MLVYIDASKPFQVLVLKAHLRQHTVPRSVVLSGDGHQVLSRDAHCCSLGLAVLYQMLSCGLYLTRGFASSVKNKTSQTKSE